MNPSQRTAMQQMLGHVRLRLNKPRALIVVAVTLICTIVPALSAQASVTTAFQDAYSLLCLDSHSTGAVFTDTCSGDKQQNWIVTDLGTNAQGDEIATLTDAYSLLCLDSQSDGDVFTATCSDAKQQEWLYANGSFQDAYSLLCLDSHSDGDVFTDACSGDKQQTWIRNAP